MGLMCMVAMDILDFIPFGHSSKANDVQIHMLGCLTIMHANGRVGWENWRFLEGAKGTAFLRVPCVFHGDTIPCL